MITRAEIVKQALADLKAAGVEVALFRMSQEDWTAFEAESLSLGTHIFFRNEPETMKKLREKYSHRLCDIPVEVT
jgi:hypothetical protein